MGILKKLFVSRDRCSKCGKKMVLAEGTIPFAEADRLQGGYQCRECGRLTCYVDSDGSEPCECGAHRWKNIMYYMV